MHDLLTIGEIRARAKRLHLPFQKITARSGVDYSTFTRASQAAARGETEPVQVRKLKALGDALVAEERELLAYLLGLHGLPAGDHHIIQQGRAA